LNYKCIKQQSSSGGGGGSSDESDGECTDTCSSLIKQCGTHTICGNSVNCGSCITGYVCSSGFCIQNNTCIANCSGKSCGENGCGGVCGSCYFPHTSSSCNSNYQCVISSCDTGYEDCDSNSNNGCETYIGINGNCNSLNYIVENGIGYADIIVSSNAVPSVRLAADYFQMYVYNITGVNLLISNAPNTSKNYHVYIGQSNYTDSLGITDEGCTDGGFKMVSGSNYLVLLGQDDLANMPGMNEAPGPSDYSEWDAYVETKWGEDFKWGNDVIEFYPGSYNYDYDIWEADKKGTLNAVYEFLYNQGVRWYYPGWYEYEDLGIIIPEKQDISFTNMNVLKNPDFAMRTFSVYGKEYNAIGSYHYDGRSDEETQWRFSLRTNNWYEFIIASTGGPAHGIRAVITRQTDHPEYYAIADGVRQMNVDYPNPNLCFPYYTSQNRLFEENVKYVKTMFDLYNSSMVSVMPNDGLGYISDECEERETYERGLEGMLSDYVWEYVNNVAWEVYNDPKYSGNMIINSAYTPYSLPPLNLSKPIAPNLAVMITKGRSELGDPEANANFENLTNWWLNVLASNNYLTGGRETNKLYTYDYYMHNADYRPERSSPAYFPHIISDNLKFLNGKSSGEFIEIVTLSGWPPYEYTTKEWTLEWDAFISNSLNTYITALLYWDVDQDTDAIMEEYYNLFYGPASSKMKQLIEYSEDNYATSLHNPAFMNNIRQMADDALAMVPVNSKYAQRISLLVELVNLDYAGDEVLINSCQTLDSIGTTYKLTNDVSSTGTCMIIDDSGITLDCQGHSITYSTAGGANDHAIYNNAFQTSRGDYFNIKNCVIKDGSYLTGSETGSAIYLDHADAGVLENNVINVSGLGIYTLCSLINLYKGNNVTGYEQAFYTQINEGYPPSNNTFINNKFSSVSGSAAYLYRTENENITNNKFYSVGDYGLHLNLGSGTYLQNNLFSSQTTDGFNAYEIRGLVEIGNTYVNGN
jgi:parallel beta-helix repeat protein